MCKPLKRSLWDRIIPAIPGIVDPGGDPGIPLLYSTGYGTVRDIFAGRWPYQITGRFENLIFDSSFNNPYRSISITLILFCSRRILIKAIS